MSLNIYKFRIIGIDSEASATKSNTVLPTHTDTLPLSLRNSSITVGE